MRRLLFASLAVVLSGSAWADGAFNVKEPDFISGLSSSTKSSIERMSCWRSPSPIKFQNCDYSVNLKTGEAIELGLKIDDDTNVLRSEMKYHGKTELSDGPILDFISSMVASTRLDEQIAVKSAEVIGHALNGDILPPMPAGVFIEARKNDTYLWVRISKD